MSKSIRPFDPDKNYTQFHNYVLDTIMPQLSGNTWKVLCFIIRKTKGWNREEEQLSYSTIREGTGIKSDTTLSSVLRELVALDYIHVQDSGQWKAHVYSLNTEFEVTPPTSNSVPTPNYEVAPTPKIEVEPTPKNGDIKRKEVKETTTKKELATQVAVATPPAPPAPPPTQKNEFQEIKTAWLSRQPGKNINHGQAGTGLNQLLKAGNTPEEFYALDDWLRAQDWVEPGTTIYPQTYFKKLDQFRYVRERGISTPQHNNYANRGTSKVAASLAAIDRVFAKLDLEGGIYHAG
jgi:phage replication O-like protein O